LSLYILQASESQLIQPVKKPYTKGNQPLAGIMQRSMETNEPKNGDSKFSRRPVESDAKDALDTVKSPPPVVQRSELLTFYIELGLWLMLVFVLGVSIMIRVGVRDAWV